MEVRYWEEKEEWDSLINDGGGWTAVEWDRIDGKSPSYA